MFCNSCGGQLGPNDKFCGNCGTPIGGGAPTAAPQAAPQAAQFKSPQAAPAKKGGMPKWVKILLGVFVFIVVIVVVANVATAPLVKPIEQQLRFLRNGDIQGAYNLTSRDFKNATSLEQFAAIVRFFPSLSRNKSCTFNEKEIKNNIGTVRGTLRSEDGAVTPIVYTLVKEDGQWKIISFTVNPSN